MTCLFLSRREFRVIYLGPNLPVVDLIDTIQEIRPALVLLSASTPQGAVNLARSSHEIKQACKAHGTSACDPEIGFGGKIFLDMPFHQDGVDGIFCGRDADEAVETIETVFDRASRAANHS